MNEKAHQRGRRKRSKGNIAEVNNREFQGGNNSDVLNAAGSSDRVTENHQLDLYSFMLETMGG